MPLFASGRQEPRARRPTDVALVLTGLLTILFASVLAKVAAQVEAAFAEALAEVPTFFDPLWLALVWVPVGWVAVIVVTALVRRRPALVRDMLGGVILALVFAVIVGELVTGDAWAVLSHMGDVRGQPAFPPGVITVTAAALGVASPHLVRPCRHLGRWLLALSLIHI